MIYRRILLKLSGEALGGGRSGIDSRFVLDLVNDISAVADRGVQVAIVCGGGNIFRGIAADSAIDRTAADAMGMLATMINGLALREFFRSQGRQAVAMAAYPVEGILPAFSAEHARNLLDSGHIVILTGGTGLPYFSTDTAAVMRALQINADVMIKATKVDGIFDRDPLSDPTARKFSNLTFNRVLELDLKVMDAAAIALCRDNNLPVVVFNLLEKGHLGKLMAGERIGTRVMQEDMCDD
ncbi:UMP kinase [bacterium]|nr:UMP kinase [candidate division CSSED10-310 bacterium]